MTERMPFHGLLVLLLMSLILAGCGADPAEVATCRRVIAAFEPDAAKVEVLRETADPAGSDGVVLDYRTPDGVERWVNCRFSARRVERAPLELVRVATSREGLLPEMSLFWLKRWLALEAGPARPVSGPVVAVDRVVDSPYAGVLYALQQTLNGTV